ncbi:alpha/beta hydrolase [Lacinutrix sp. Hel_I_90]|uniref:alpha/beta hydrolase n=1 Tax=Lacinutrix sp. Hel_I_90 TaxID=1249999 RepID=UPI0005C9DBCE|nr:alpha/beta hydrolase [Lacinutrix sp. Hel_I_90]
MKNTFTFSIRNVELFGQYWTPETAKGVVVLVHGMGEHSGRYEDSVVPHLLKNNYAVVAYDQFGHGQSHGKRGHCPSYEALLESFEYVINRAKLLFSDVPAFLYGHSLGGNVVINYAIRKQPEVKGIVATSPFLRLAFQPPKWKVALGKLMLKILPSITLPSEIEEAAISSIPNEVKRYQEDPLIHDKISPMYLFPVMEAGKYAIHNAHKIMIPTLLFHGKADRIIDYKGSVEFQNNAKLGEVQLFENGYHELHHDIYKEEMLQSVVKWLDNL